VSSRRAAVRRRSRAGRRAGEARPSAASQLRRLACSAVLLLTVAGCDPAGDGQLAAPTMAPLAAAPPAPPALPGSVRYLPYTAPTGASTAGTGTPRASGTTSTPPGSTPSASPAVAAGPCLPLYGPNTPVPVTVSATTGTAVMTWWHNGDPAALAYWVGVQVQSTGAATLSRTITWTRLVPPAGCRTISFPLLGLVRGTAYTLWLDLEATTPETTTGVTRHTLDQITDIALP
jgi:hypothetical protein